MSDIQAEIRRIVAFATQQHAADWKDEEAWDALEAMIRTLDARCGSGLAVGRFLQFQVASPSATYLIDAIEQVRVHVEWLANPDEREADAVDRDGYCLRSVAEAQCQRHDEQRAGGWL